jgi:signal transduction histidine kinase
MPLTRQLFVTGCGLLAALYDGAQTRTRIRLSLGGRGNGKISNFRKENVLSDHIASNRYIHESERKLNGVESPFRHSRAVPALRPHSAPSRKRLDDHPTWLPRGARARNDVNGQFMAVLSHELRNSLCVMRMAAGILNTEISATPAVEKARTLIEHQITQMSRLVDDLLDTSPARDGHLVLKREKVDLCVVAAQALQSVESTMQRRSHCMTVSLPVGPLWLRADPARLEQVFVNLLFNAAKYTASGGDIRLSVERQEGEAVVRIRDNGIGIAPHVLPRVFDLFVQADPSPSELGAGLGIGLALVRNLVDRHGGCVTAASVGLGHGSEFVVRLPMPG